MENLNNICTGQQQVWLSLIIDIGYTATSVKHQYHNHPSITSCIIQLSNHSCSIPSDTSVYKDEVLTLVAKFTIIPAAVIMELLVSVYIVKSNYDTMLKAEVCW